MRSLEQLPQMMQARRERVPEVVPGDMAEFRLFGRLLEHIKHQLLPVGNAAPHGKQQILRSRSESGLVFSYCRLPYLTLRKQRGLLAPRIATSSSLSASMRK